jgi:uncharacterized protein
MPAFCPRHRGRAAWLLLFVALLPLFAVAAEIPPLKARVTDLTGTLNAQQRSALEQTLAEFEQRKGAQIAVLMVPTTAPETVEQYAVRVQESWKLGRKGVDDGVLLVVAKNDRRLHIEVGYGLEGILPDAVAKRIIEEDIAPRFRESDFYGGIRAGVDRIMRVAEGEKLPPPAARSHPKAQGISFDWVLPLLFVALIAGTILRAVFGRFIGSGIAGGVVGFAAWALVGSLFVALIAGVMAFIFMLGGASRGWAPGYRRGGFGGWGGGFGGGGWGGGGFGGGGGGFSGGGGSSGGGGASGSW